MKLKAKQIFSLAVVGALFLGNFFYFSITSGKAETSASLAQSYKINIMVTEAQTASNILPQVFGGSGSSAIDCTAPFVAPGNLVQGQAVINLNQPGSCFNLSVTELPRFGPSLSVEPFIRVVSRIIVLPQTKISSAYELPLSRPSRTSSAIPIPLTAGIIFYFGIGLVFVRTRKKLLETIRKNLSLEQSQIMRC